MKFRKENFKGVKVFVCNGPERLEDELTSFLNDRKATIVDLQFSCFFNRYKGDSYCALLLWR